MGDIPSEKVSRFGSLIKCFKSVGTAEEITEGMDVSIDRLTKEITGGRRTGFVFNAVRRNNTRF
jgi:hypothetical protein